MVVVLPAPLGPRKPCTSPVRTLRSRPVRARVGPNDFVKPEMAIAMLEVETASALVMRVNIHYIHKFVKL